MSKGRILVVEDDHDIGNMLKIYFTGQGYDIEVSRRGGDALQLVQAQLPQLIVLDINLPDTDGYTVCRTLRTNTRTKHVPVIFLTDKDGRSDRIAGLELGADDYITKPFDIEELRLRIGNAIRASERMGLTDPRSGLPSGRLIEDELREMVRRPKWAYGDLRITNFEPFKEKYGFVAGDEVLRFSAMLINEVVDANGKSDDFIGHPGGDNFVIITEPGSLDSIRKALKERFNEEVKSHYSFIDREKGSMTIDESQGAERQVPLMTMVAGFVSSERDFSDIREITEAAAEERRKDAAASAPAAPRAEAPKAEAPRPDAPKPDQK